MSAPPLTLSRIFEQAEITPRLYHLGREIAPCSFETFQGLMSIVRLLKLHVISLMVAYVINIVFSCGEAGRPSIKR